MPSNVPTLYWISGSTPAWRIILALTVKGIPFNSRRLDHSAGENKTPSYLALNPKGQVPTLVLGDLIVRESMAILAWLDRAFPERPIWGDDTANAAHVWQDVMIFEQELHPLISHTAKALLRHEPLSDGVTDDLLQAMDELNARLGETTYLGGDHLMANDIWLYPALHWIARGVQLNSNAPLSLENLTRERKDIGAWMKRVSAEPGIAETYPPHWQ